MENQGVPRGEKAKVFLGLFWFGPKFLKFLYFGTRVYFFVNRFFFCIIRNIFRLGKSLPGGCVFPSTFPKIKYPGGPGIFFCPPKKVGRGPIFPALPKIGGKNLWTIFFFFKNYVLLELGFWALFYKCVFIPPTLSFSLLVIVIFFIFPWGEKSFKGKFPFSV